MKTKGILGVCLCGMLMLLSVNAVIATLESRWDYTQPGWITEIYAMDIDNDGSIEILAGMDNANLYTLTYNGKIKWVYNTEKELSEINDFHLSADTIALGSDDVYTLKSIGIQKWKSYIEGNANAVFIKDLEKDGHEEVIAGSNKNKIYVFDDKGKIKWEYQTNEPVRTIYAGDIDKDGSIEIIAGSGIRTIETGAYSGGIYVLDKDGNLEWNYEIPVESSLVSDLDNDGFYEIIAGSLKEDIYGLDSKGNLKWKFETDKVVTRIYAENIDMDSSKEIIAGSPPFLYVIDKNGGEVWRQELNGSTYDIFVTDLEGDGVKEILVGSHIYAYIFDPDGNIRERWRMPIWDAEIKGVFAADLYGTGTKNLVLGYNWFHTYLDRSDKKSRIEVFEVKSPADDIEEYADTLYEKSEEFYVLQDYTNAQEYAKKAKYNYIRAGNGNSSLKCDILILKTIADEDYSKAADYLIFGDYENAIKFARESKRDYIEFQKKFEEFRALKDYRSWVGSSPRRNDIYMEFEDVDWIKKADSLLDKSENYLKAEEYYQMAKEYYKKHDYTLASKYAQMAKNIYKFFDDEDSIKRVSGLISISPYSTTESSNLDILLCIIGILAIIAIIMFVFIFKKKGKGK